MEEQFASADKGYLTPSQREEAAQAALRSRDTDQDGLTDYDEQEVYRTSAYLKDSDSDGIDDRAEVVSGGNPNCPTGTDCGGLADAQAAGSVSLTVPEPAPATMPAAAFKDEDDLRAYFASLSPVEIRAALSQAGVPQETIVGLTDAEIKDLFDKTIDEAISSGQFSDLVGSGASNP